MAIATPGDHGQPQSIFQVLVNVYDRGQNLQAAIEAPRMRHDAGLDFMMEDRAAPGLVRVRLRGRFSGAQAWSLVSLDGRRECGDAIEGRQLDVRSGPAAIQLCRECQLKI